MEAGLEGHRHVDGRSAMVARVAIGLLIAVHAASAVELAAYDVGGRITALLTNADDVEIATNVVAILPNGKRIRLQTRREDASR